MAVSTMIQVKESLFKIYLKQSAMSASEKMVAGQVPLASTQVLILMEMV